MASNKVAIKLGLVTCVARREAKRSPLFNVCLEDAGGEKIADIRLTSGEWDSWVQLGELVRR